MEFRTSNFHPRPFASPLFHTRKVGPRTTGGFTVPQLVQIYGGIKIKRITPTVPLIAIVELGGGYKPGDNVTAFSADGLPTPTINEFSISGAKNSPGDDADGEVALDIQVAAKVYSALTGEQANLAMIWSPNTDTGFAAAVAKAGSLGAVSCSVSWGAPESQWTAQSISVMGSALQANLNANCVTFAASGDNDSGDGQSGNNVDFPASHPLTIGCGGTSLMVSGQTYSEKVWNDGRGSGTGGGLSRLFAKPAYQNNVLGTTSQRGVPDVSACADPNTGYRIFLNGQWGIIGGTSAVAPFYAGLAAAFAAGGIRFSLNDLATRLYSLPGIFQDISVGNNNGFKASVGYDCCSGLGTPKIATLFNALGGVPNPPPVIVPPPVTTSPPILGTTNATILVSGSNLTVSVSTSPTVTGKAISMDLQTTVAQLIADIQAQNWVLSSKDAAMLYAEVIGLMNPLTAKNVENLAVHHAGMTTEGAIEDCVYRLRAAKNASTSSSFDWGSISPILIQLLTLLLTKIGTAGA